jgi:hypothetical protein
MGSKTKSLVFTEVKPGFFFSDSVCPLLMKPDIKKSESRVRFWQALNEF